MTEETETEEEVNEEAEGQTEEQEAPKESEAETKAREMGWRPAEEWEGDSSRHLSAEDFLKRNDHLKSRGDEILRQDNQRLERELREVRTTLDGLKDHFSKAENRAYEKARKEIEGQMRSAAEEGDTQAYDAAKRDMDELDRDIKEASKAKAPDYNPDEDPDFLAWTSDNAWYNNDPFLTAEADKIAPVIARKRLTGRAHYDAITAALKTEYPSKFDRSNPKRERPSAVEGANGSGGGKKTLWEQVPKGPRETFSRFVSEGLYKDTKEDREKYADEYLNG